MVGFFLLVGLSGLLGCNSESNQPNARIDELERADELINQKQFSEAIFVLESRLKANPKEIRARVLLASAYAGRSGIELRSFNDFARELEKWSQIDTLWPAEQDFSAESATARAAVSAVLQAHLVIRAFAALPVLSSPHAAADLTMALQILDEAGPLRGGPSLYRALLRVVQFKQNLRHEMRPNMVPNNAVCVIATSDLAQWVALVTSAMRKIAADVANGLAAPEAKKRALELLAQIDALEKNLANAVGRDQGQWVQVPETVRRLYGNSCS
jgi:tetratricopeptide (TPR) repeat protein